MAVDAEALLARLVGRWRGRARLWLRPGELHCEEEVRGGVRALHGGRWVLHEYETRVDGADASGTALIGCDGGRGLWQVAWADTWHTGGAIFFSEGRSAPGDALVAVETTYGDPGGGDPWGWRTELEPRERQLHVRHYNVTPAAEEALAVELVYDPA